MLRIAPFNVRIRSPLATVKDHFQRFYTKYPVLDQASFVDFDLRVCPGVGIRRFWKPQSRFFLDEVDAFFPLPQQQAAPMFEWGLNWCVASRPLGYLVMHAGVLAKRNAALMMPGHPGAGKSTLTASLNLLGGWRLLSDELAILDPETGDLLPHPRPICLKNEAIDIVAGFDGAVMGRQYTDTRKGTISHVSCDRLSIENGDHRAKVNWVVFPRFEKGCRAKSSELSRVEAFSMISEQSFNRERMGEAGFDAMCAMLDNASCHQIQYGSTQAGLDLIKGITER